LRIDFDAEGERAKIAAALGAHPLAGRSGKDLDRLRCDGRPLSFYRVPGSLSVDILSRNSEKSHAPPCVDGISAPGVNARGARGLAVPEKPSDAHQNSHDAGKNKQTGDTHDNHDTRGAS
jgi:hypothetical protein